MAESDDRSLAGTSYTAVDTPNFLGGNLNFTNPRSGNPYFNRALFSPEDLGYYGTANRRFFHGPGINNWDISLQKDVRLTESKTLEIRGELFNAFNHAQFFGPEAVNGNPDSTNFGRIVNAQAPRQLQLAAKFTF